MKNVSIRHVAMQWRCQFRLFSLLICAGFRYVPVCRPALPGVCGAAGGVVAVWLGCVVAIWCGAMWCEFLVICGTLRNRLSHSRFALPWAWLCRTGRFGLPYGPFCTAKRAVLFGKTALAVRLPLRVGMFRVAQVGSRPAVVACRRRPCATDIFCPCVLKIPRMIICCGLKCVTLQRFLR